MEIKFNQPSELDLRWLGAMDVGMQAVMSASLHLLTDQPAPFAHFPAVVIVDRYLSEQTKETGGNETIKKLNDMLGDGREAFRRRIVELQAEGIDWFTSTTEAAIKKNNLDTVDPSKAARLRAQNQKIVDEYSSPDFFENHVVSVVEHFRAWRSNYTDEQLNLSTALGIDPDAAARVLAGGSSHMSAEDIAKIES